jgi:hypothetical protein
MNTTAVSSKKLRLVALGVTVRLIGVLFLWLGDGSQLLWRKALVILGVMLSVGGIGMLRYLLLSGPLTRLSAAWARRKQPAA